MKVRHNKVMTDAERMERIKAIINVSYKDIADKTGIKVKTLYSITTWQAKISDRTANKIWQSYPEHSTELAMLGIGNGDPLGIPQGQQQASENQSLAFFMPRNCPGITDISCQY